MLVGGRWQPAASGFTVRQPCGIREIDSGSVHINWTPLWRADLMPYGGLKGSGIGKEWPRRAVAEMTEEKTIVLHGLAWLRAPT
jgi:acyl-CoA reductase-like NAD-dependent aldehyde dehydrogenase